jgi:hypothetical protein
MEQKLRYSEKSMTKDEDYQESSYYQVKDFDSILY